VFAQPGDDAEAIEAAAGADGNNVVVVRFVKPGSPEALKTMGDVRWS
jgi:hypothetical protein